MRVLVFCYAAVGCGGVIVCVWCFWVWDGVVFLPMGMDLRASKDASCGSLKTGEIRRALFDKGYHRAGSAPAVPHTGNRCFSSVADMVSARSMLRTMGMYSPGSAKRISVVMACRVPPLF